MTSKTTTLAIWVKAGEEVRIGDDVRIAVDRIKCGNQRQCRLVVFAPKDKIILREKETK